MNLQDLMIFKETFYTLSHIPLFYLNKDHQLISQTNDFPSLSNDFFCDLMSNVDASKAYNVSYTDYEIYICFQLPTVVDHITAACMGPIVYNLPKYIINYDFLYLFQHAPYLSASNVITQLPQLNEQLFPYIQLCYGCFIQKTLTRNDFYEYFYKPRDLKHSQSFFDVVSKQREQGSNTSEHYQEELKLLNAIRNGNSAYARIHASKLASGQIGMMSINELQNKKYALIAGITLISRTAIEAGVNVENAFALSDVYCKTIDETFDNKRLMSIFYDAIMDYCKLVQVSSYQDYPMWIRSCVQYLDQHLHTAVTLDDLSEQVHLAPTYISVQFKKVVGKSIKQYLNEQRIHEARFLLKTSDISIQEIAFTLNFGTQSYFTKVFKSITNELPTTYRNRKKQTLP